MAKRRALPSLNKDQKPDLYLMNPATTVDSTDEEHAENSATQANENNRSSSRGGAGALRHSVEGALHDQLYGYGDALNLLRSHSIDSRVGRIYNILLDLQSDRGRENGGPADLFQMPALPAAFEAYVSAEARSALPREKLSLEFFDALAVLREKKIIEILPALTLSDHSLSGREYIVAQRKNTSAPLPVQKLEQQAQRESLNVARMWLKQRYSIPVPSVIEAIGKRDPVYYRYLPYFHMLGALRLEWEQYMRERLEKKNAGAGQPRADAEFHLHPRYAIHCLQPVYAYLTGTSLDPESNALVIDAREKGIVRHPSAWSTAHLPQHLEIFAALIKAFRASLDIIEDNLSRVADSEFRKAYSAYKQEPTEPGSGESGPDPGVLRGFIEALFRVFDESIQDAQFDFVRNCAIEILDHTRTLAAANEKERRGRLEGHIKAIASRVRAVEGRFANLEELVPPELLEEFPNFFELLGNPARTGVCTLRMREGRRVFTGALHAENVDALQAVASRLAADKHDLSLLLPLQAMYRRGIDDPARCTPEMHHNIASYYQQNQPLLYKESLSWWKRLWYVFILWLTGRKHGPLREIETANARLLQAREAAIGRAESAQIKSRRRTLARKSLGKQSGASGPELKSREVASINDAGRRHVEKLTQYWESPELTIPVSRELSALLKEPLDLIRVHMGEEYHELPLRGSDRLVIPMSYYRRQRKAILGRIDRFLHQRLDDTGRLYGAYAAGLDPIALDALKRKITFVENIKAAIEHDIVR